LLYAIEKGNKNSIMDRGRTHLTKASGTNISTIIIFDIFMQSGWADDNFYKCATIISFISK